MKQCSRCKETKPVVDFAWRRRDRGQRDTYCRPCRAKYKQEHYARNKERYIASAARRNRRVAEERWLFLIEYFATHPCFDCGESDPMVLEFDHLGEKSFGISGGLRYRRWEEVLAEMAKCDVVCANCHRRRTAHRGGFLRATAVAESAPVHDTQRVLDRASALPEQVSADRRK